MRDPSLPWMRVPTALRAWPLRLQDHPEAQWIVLRTTLCTCGCGGTRHPRMVRRVLRNMMFTLGAPPNLPPLVAPSLWGHRIIALAQYKTPRGWQRCAFIIVRRGPASIGLGWYSY